VREKADSELLSAIGLGGGACLLLPSFLTLLRELKKAKRSFSICFRTFGKDLPKLANEYNAVCTGKHPLFHHGYRHHSPPTTLQQPTDNRRVCPATRCRDGPVFDLAFAARMFATKRTR
jgi:hypothetical protein